MSTIKLTPSTKPKCPNHGCPLDGIGFPMPRKGEGICPVSGAHFTFEVNTDESTFVVDTQGNLIKQKRWNVTGND